MLGMLVAALLPTFTPSCPLVVAIRESPDDWSTHDAIVTACAFSRPEEQEVLLPLHFGTLVLLSHEGHQPMALVPVDRPQKAIPCRLGRACRLVHL